MTTPRSTDTAPAQTAPAETAPGQTAPGEAAEALSAEQQAELDRADRRRRRKRALALLLGLLVVAFAILFGWYLFHRDPLPLPGLGKQPLPHYSYSLYGTSRPMGVAVNPDGDRVYVTSSDGPRRVQVYDRAGHKTGTLTPPAATGPAHVPVYVAVDPKTSEVYVSDRAAQAVYVYGPNGAYRSTFTPRGELGGTWQPLGLAFDPAGLLYVTEVSTSPHRVLVLRHDGTLVRTIGAGTGLSFPNGLAIGPAGNIYLADSNNGRLVIYSPTGKQLATVNRGVAAGDLGLPRGVAFDHNNRFYVVDTASHTIKSYKAADPHDTTPMPAYTGTFGAEGQLDGTFEYPNGIATDPHNRIYITDRENNRVQVWTY
jgi:DNA-binding beta-propeller fold protein YncE